MVFHTEVFNIAVVKGIISIASSSVIVAFERSARRWGKIQAFK